jgi:hypothetical protein
MYLYILLSLTHAKHVLYQWATQPLIKNLSDTELF